MRALTGVIMFFRDLVFVSVNLDVVYAYDRTLFSGRTAKLSPQKLYHNLIAPLLPDFEISTYVSWWQRNTSPATRSSTPCLGMWTLCT